MTQDGWVSTLCPQAIVSPRTQTVTPHCLLMSPLGCLNNISNGAPFSPFCAHLQTDPLSLMAVPWFQPNARAKNLGVFLYTSLSLSPTLFSIPLGSVFKMYVEVSLFSPLPLLSPWSKAIISVALQLVSLCFYCKKHSSQNLSPSEFVKAFVLVFRILPWLPVILRMARALTVAARPPWSLLSSTPPTLLLQSLWHLCCSSNTPGVRHAPAMGPFLRFALPAVLSPQLAVWFVPSPPSGLLQITPPSQAFLDHPLLGSFAPFSSFLSHYSIQHHLTYSLFCLSILLSISFTRI